MAGEYFEWNFKKTLLLLFLTVFNLVYVCFCKMYFILCILVIGQQDPVDNNFYWRVILDKYSIIIIIVIIINIFIINKVANNTPVDLLCWGPPY